MSETPPPLTPDPGTAVLLVAGSALTRSGVRQEQMVPNKFKRTLVSDHECAGGGGAAAAVTSWQSVQVGRPRDWGKGRVALNQFYNLDDRYVSEKAAATGPVSIVCGPLTDHDPENSMVSMPWLLKAVNLMTGQSESTIDVIVIPRIPPPSAGVVNYQAPFAGWLPPLGVCMPALAVEPAAPMTESVGVLSRMVRQPLNYQTVFAETPERLYRSVQGLPCVHDGYIVDLTFATFNMTQRFNKDIMSRMHYVDRMLQEVMMSQGAPPTESSCGSVSTPLHSLSLSLCTDISLLTQ